MVGKERVCQTTEGNFPHRRAGGDGHTRRQHVGARQQPPQEEVAVAWGEKGVRLSSVHPLSHTKFGWH